MKVIFLRIPFYFDYLLELGTSCQKNWLFEKNKYEIWRIRGSLSKFSRSKKSKEFAPKKHALLVLAYSQKYEGCLKNFHFYILFIAKFG
jgi:hypothetical protein